MGKLCPGNLKAFVLALSSFSRSREAIQKYLLQIFAKMLKGGREGYTGMQNFVFINEIYTFSWKGGGLHADI